MSDAQAHQEFTQGRTRRHRWWHLLAIGLGLAIVCGSGTALAALPSTTPPTQPPSTEAPVTEPPATEPPVTEPAPESTAVPTTTVAPAPVPPPAPAPVDIDLVPQCTSSEDIDAGTRTFRLDNNGTEPVEVTLRNVATGGSVSGTAAPGSSTWEVPAGDGSNTTEVVANGEVVATSDSTNLLCGALHGQAECNPSNGTTTITWTVSNNDGSPAIVLSDSRGVDFQPNPDAPHGASTGVEVVDGPANDDEITETVTIQLSNGETSELSASVTAAACTGPSLTPDVAFTFTKTASVPTAGVADTVEYVYCGQNTGSLPLEVVRLVDDRLGVVIELPGVETVVAPGDSLCNTDIGQPVTYTVRLADVGTTITNHAVVTVRTQEATPRVFQATATATVDVALSPPVLTLLAGREKTWVCHRTLSATNPFNLINVSSASTDAAGHVNHEQDIIPPGPWGPGQNYNPVDMSAIWLNECANVKAQPLSPSLIQPTCQRGVVIPGDVVLPNKPVGVTYSFAPTSLGDGTANVAVTVTATLKLGYEWNNALPAGWTRVDNTATWTGTLKGTSCSAVAPVAPAIEEAACTGGELHPPSLTLAETDNVTYIANPDSGYRPGDTVTVTATLATGATWAADISPWTRTPPTATKATYTYTFKPVTCTSVTPAEPDPVPASCAAGAVIPPDVNVGPTDGVIYTVSAIGDGATDVEVRITATVLDSFAWPDSLPAGWTHVGDHKVITYTLTLTAAECAVVSPVAPDLNQAVCTNGVVTPPTLTVPENTTNISYSANPSSGYVAGGTVTVTATLTGDGVRWPTTPPAGWTFKDAQTATFEMTFAPVACTLVPPVTPVVGHATCTGGVVVPATVTLPDTEGVTYTMDPEDLGDGTTLVSLTVTAVLADGFEWGSLGDDWVEVDDTTAELTLELSGASCDAVTPAAPTVTQAVCADGGLSAPSLELATTDDVTYTVDPAEPYAVGQSVIVTATLDPAGVAWGDALPAGWTAVDDQTATFALTFDDAACVAVLPADPVILPPGPSTEPVLELPVTPGITYTVEPGSPGSPPVISAVIPDGYEWGPLPDQWTQVDATTAIFAPALPAPTTTGGVLAHTGAATVILQSLLAFGMLVLGFGLYGLGRRRTVG